MGPEAVMHRAQGCMLGQIAGDALGSMVEFQTSEQIRERYPAGLRVIEGSSVFRTLPGQPTDDSELAILLARSILSAGRYEQEAAANAYVWWYRSGPFDIGRATGRALSAGAEAPDGSAARACESGADTDTQANGALMRVSPLGIHCWNKEEGEIARLARLDCRLTHPNEICQDSNVIFVLAVARAVRTGETGALLWKYARETAARFRLHASVSQALDSAAAAPADFITHAGWVLVALQNAFYQLSHAASLEEGVVDTVRRGGDTDTNAAICGALLGAVHGVDAIPLQWREAVLSCRPEPGALGVHRPRPRELWPVDCLTVAEGLVVEHSGAFQPGAPVIDPGA